MDLLEYAKTEDVSRRHPWELAKSYVVNDMLKRFNLVKDEINILDLGCGDTYIVEQIVKTYPNLRLNVHAVDIAFTQDILESLKNKYEKQNVNIRVYNSLEDIKTANIDVVLLLDVIEHIEDEISFLKNLLSHEYITKATKILITVPAFQSLFSSHDYFLKHFRRYSNKTLQNRLNQVPLKIELKGYFFFILLFFRFLVKLKESFIKKEVTGIGAWNGSSFLTKTLHKILILDYHLFSKVGIPGLSNYAVCTPV